MIVRLNLQKHKMRNEDNDRDDRDSRRLIRTQSNTDST